MNKYTGCNIVESVVTSPEKPPVPRKKSRLRGFIIRTLIACGVIGLICAVRFIPISAFDGVREVLKDVFCYDVFGRTGFGSTVFFGGVGA